MDQQVTHRGARPEPKYAGCSGVFVALGVCLLAAAIEGCQRSVAAVDSGAARPREVRLGYFANLAHAQAVLGVSSGEYAAAIAPAKLVTRVFNAGPALVESLFAGEIDIGYVGPGPALNGYVRSRGEGLRIISGAAANGVCIVARRGAGIRSPADLKGRRIATPQYGNTQDISARFYLTRQLGQPNADNVIPIANAEQIGLMRRGEIDAAWAPEPWAARLIVEADGTLLAEEKDIEGGRPFALAVVIASPEFLRRDAESTRKLLAAHASWTERLRSAPVETSALLGSALRTLTGQSIPPEAFRDAFSRTAFTDDPLPESLRSCAQRAYELGFATSRADLSEIFELSKRLPPE